MTFRAKTQDKTIEFPYFYENKAIHKINSYHIDGWIGAVDIPIVDVIDPLTLEITFDGKKWFKMDEVKEILGKSRRKKV